MLMVFGEGQDIVIKFRCPSCSQKLTAPQQQAGKISKCPKCKSEITVPQISPETSTTQKETEVAATEQPELLDKKMFDLPQTQNRSDAGSEPRRQGKELLESFGFKPAPQYTGERKLPWPIDILLYLCSVPGLTALAVIVGFPFMLSLIQRFLGSIGAVLASPLFVVDILIGIYAGWYLAECVQDSAKGGTRAPKALAAAAGLSEMWSRVLYLLVVYLVFVLPAVLYRIYTDQTNVIFWMLVAWAIVFFPMGLLAMVMFDSTYALNPLFLIGSISRVFFQYAGLLVLFGILAGLLWLVPGGPRVMAPAIWLEIVGAVTSGYGVFVAAHLLGRFYWRYKDRLDWGI